MGGRNEGLQFPQWILREVRNSSVSLNGASLSFLEKVVDLYPHFDQRYISAADRSNLEALSTYDLDQIANLYHGADPRLVILRSEYEQFYFVTCYQIRELAPIFAKAFADGDFYTSVIIARSVLEISSCAHYILRRLQSKFIEISKVATSSQKTKSADQKRKLHIEFLTKIYEAFSHLHRANRASGFPWAEHLGRFGVELNDASFGKVLHTGTCMEDISKAYKLPIESCYAVLSEFVHPNFGSKTLLVGSREPINAVMDRLKIGSVNREEKCLWFVDHISESLYHTLNLALTFHQSGGELYTFICDLSESTMGTDH
jgi:hypothetical protein